MQFCKEIGKGGNQLSTFQKALNLLRLHPEGLGHLFCGSVFQRDFSVVIEEPDIQDVPHLFPNFGKDQSALFRLQPDTHFFGGFPNGAGQAVLPL